jgi:hypothetical protein
MITEYPLWIAWLLMFVAIEVPAIFNKKRGDTWSSVVRYFFGFSKRAGDLQSNGMRLRRASFYVLSVTLFLHFTGDL